MASGLWITPEELEGALGSDPNAAEACSMASFVLWAFSGRKYGRTRTVVETYECACKRRTDWYMPYQFPAMPLLDGGVLSNVSTATLSSCGCPGVVGGRHVRLRLRGTPVRRIHKVMRGSEVLEPGTYRVENSGLLTLDSGTPGDVCGLEVTYTYGTGIPGGGRLAAKLLAQEFVKGWSGDEECRLPSRVTNVSREGISFTVLDKQDFLDELRTGIYEVDLFLRAVNPDKARKKARVFSPDLPKAYRVTANGVHAPALPGGPRPYDFEIIQGAAFERGWRKYDSTGTAIDLSLYSWRAEVRVAEDDGSTMLLDMTPYMSLNGTDPSLVEVSVPGNITDLLPEGGGYWDLFLWPTSSPSSTVKWLYGTVVVETSATNMAVI